MADNFTNEAATVARLPSHDGDGYGWGGDYIVCLGGYAIKLGPRDEELAQEIAARWNNHIGVMMRPDPDELAF